MIDPQVRADISALRSEIESLRAEMSVSNPLPIWNNQRVNHFIPEAGVDTGASDPTSPTTPGGGGDPTALGHIYAFESFANDSLTGIIMEPGDIVLGPSCPNAEWIEWASFGTTTPSVSATDTFVYLIIDIAEGSYGATMSVGSKSAMQGALTGDDLKAKMVWPLVETVWADGAITKVKGLQCGNVVIPRL